MGRRIGAAGAAVVCAAVAAAQAGASGGASELRCEMAAMCEDGDCRALGIEMEAGVEGDTAWIGPPGDRLMLTAVPVEFPSQRLFAVADGPHGDAVVLALHDDGRLVMFQSPAQPLSRFAAIVGQCREAG